MTLASRYYKRVRILLIILFVLALALWVVRVVFQQTVGSPPS